MLMSATNPPAANPLSIRPLNDENCLMRPVYIVDGSRTPFMKARGVGPFTPVDLAVQCGRPLLLRQPFARDAFDQVILGIVNVRGRILPVLDLKRFFGLPQRGLTDLHRIILLGDGRCEFGLLADLGVGVRMIPRAAIQASPPAFAGIDSTYLLGVTADRLLVLDAAALLADPRLVVDERSDEDG